MLNESVPANENLEGAESPVLKNNAYADGAVGPQEEPAMPNFNTLQSKPDILTVLNDDCRCNVGGHG